MSMATTCEPLLHKWQRSQEPRNVLRMGRSLPQGNSSDHEVRNFVLFSCLIAVVLLLSFLAFPGRTTKALTSLSPRSGDVSSQTDHRPLLPRNVFPLQYDLELNFSRPESATFTGRLNVVLECLEPSWTTITFHGSNVTVHDANISTYSGSQQISNVIVRQSDVGDFLVFDLGFEMINGTVYNLSMTFDAAYADGTVGAFVRRYAAPKTSSIVATNMLFGKARLVFPCFDEPDMKAVFNVSLVRRRDFQAVFSTEVRQSLILPPADMKDVFALGPPMAPSQLAVCVLNNFAVLSNGYSRLYGLPSEIGALNLALRASVQMLRYLDSLFGAAASYPFRRYQVVVLPSLMDSVQPSWGLVTLASQSVLYEEDAKDVGRYADVLAVLAHAVAHQWLGNLVSPRAWDYVWLYEGLASFFEARTLKRLFGGQVPRSFYAKETLEAMNVEDASGQSRRLFDATSPFCRSPVVKKARIVVDLLAESTSPELFAAAIVEFLKNHGHGSADAGDLLEAFRDRVKDAVPLSAKMDAWIRNVGYPLVQVRRRRRRGFRLVQSSFCTTYRRCFNQTWPIPVKYSVYRRGKEVSSGKVWLLKRETDLRLNITAGDSVIFNAKGTGCYRVNYELADWDRITATLRGNHTSIDASARLKTLDDLHKLAEAGLTPFTHFYSAARYLRDERDQTIWSWYTKIAEDMDKVLLPSELSDRWKKYNRRLLGSLVSTVVRGNTSEFPRAFRENILERACWYGEELCVSVSRRLLNAYLMDGSTTNVDGILPDAVLLCTGIRYGPVESWDMLWSKLYSGPFSSSLEPVLHGLSCTPNADRLWRLLNETLTSELLKKHHAYVIRSVGASAADVLLEFVLRNWDQLGDTAKPAFDLAVRGARTPREVNLLLRAHSRKPGQEFLAAALAEVTERSQRDMRWHGDHARDLMKALSDL